MPTFEKRIVVAKKDLDELYHVNNVRFVQWIQDISKAHWELLVGDEMRKNMVWVVTHHDISYKGAATEDQELRIKTYISESKGAQSMRIVEFY
ncbi:acyl-CoA thioesterase [Maribacter sp. 2-571]|uniref:acyl-CoA thioesterase n=1 Tax=Maribacter sp. 2-571 TaxID=3417569 RepID=UPI003D352A9F